MRVRPFSSSQPCPSSPRTASCRFCCVSSSIRARACFRSAKSRATCTLCTSPPPPPPAEIDDETDTAAADVAETEVELPQGPPPPMRADPGDTSTPLPPLPVVAAPPPEVPSRSESVRCRLREEEVCGRRAAESEPREGCFLCDEEDEEEEEVETDARVTKRGEPSLGADPVWMCVGIESEGGANPPIPEEEERLEEVRFEEETEGDAERGMDTGPVLLPEPTPALAMGPAPVALYAPAVGPVP